MLAPGDVIYVAPKDPKRSTGVWSLMQIPEVGGGLIAMDPHTGRVLAVVGGFSFAMSQFDRAIQARRQPGSSFKPFVYAAAIDNGYKPTSIVLDAPIEIEQGPGQDIWRPENYEKEHSAGPSTLRVGIEKSRNQMTVRLAQDMGMPIITEYAQALRHLRRPAAGALHVARRRRDDASAHGDGLLHARQRRQAGARDPDRPHPGPLGQDRLAARPARRARTARPTPGPARRSPRSPTTAPQIIDPHTAYQMTSILEGVIQRGTATSLKSLGRPLAGKTGTTNEEKDAWFIGYSPDLVVGVFVGYDTPEPDGQGPDRRPRRRADLRRLHEGGAGRQAAGPLPHPARASSWCASTCAPGCALAPTIPRHHGSLQARRGARRRLLRHRLHRHRAGEVHPSSPTTAGRRAVRARRRSDRGAAASGDGVRAGRDAA